MGIEIIKHKNILFKDVLRVIAAKSVAWPYPLESQVKWIVENLTDEYEHVFLKDGNEDKAYMNLAKISLTINDAEYMAYGIGNVCSIEKGKGYGKELMKRVDAYLEERRSPGLLFCKSSLVPFYSRLGWEEIEFEVCDMPLLSKDIHVMTYLLPEKANSLSYHGQLF